MGKDSGGDENKMKHVAVFKTVYLGPIRLYFEFLTSYFQLGFLIGLGPVEYGRLSEYGIGVSLGWIKLFVGIQRISKERRKFQGKEVRKNGTND